MSGYEKRAERKAMPAIWSGDPRDVWEGRISQNDVPPGERPCYAHGCPLLGSITESVTNAPSAQWFCRLHSGAKPHDFGEITRRLRIERDRHVDHQPANQYAGWTPEQCRAEIARIQSSPAKDPKEWAHKLRRREQVGEPLSPIQRSAWREALREHVAEREPGEEG